MQTLSAIKQSVPELTPLQLEAVMLERLREMTDLAASMKLTGTIAYLACCHAMVDIRHKQRREDEGEAGTSYVG